jgi:tetratricopeptide (TPR) repeat protein
MRALAFVLVLVVALPARAGAGDVEQAKGYFEAGSVAYDAGDYLTAIRLLEDSYRLAPRPPIAFSLAQAYRKQYVVDQEIARLKRAVELYRKYLDDVPQGGRREDAVQHLSALQPELVRLEASGRVIGEMPQSARKTQLMVLSLTKGSLASIGGGPTSKIPLTREVAAGEHKIHVEAPGYYAQDLDGVALDGQLVVVKVDLKPRPALLRVSAKAGAEISLDGQSVGEAPLRAPVQAKAGRHFLAVTLRGHHPFTEELTVVRGQEVDVKAALGRTPQRRASFWVLGGAGVLLLGGGLTTALALSAQSDAEDLYAKRLTRGLDESERKDYNRKLDRRDNLVTASVVLYGGAAVAGVTGLLLYLLDTPRVEGRQSSFEPVVEPGSVGARWVGRF